ncbi:FtsX-like permease family protein [Streptomyces sp. NPDC058614]|uniref:FtsX-like permease family protein n=1 Tax=Streptomyces sp. NPDC058614 TaxID=3346557 RepID=UPI003660CC6A
MRELFLGLRLLVGSGRGNRTRFLLMTVGGAIGVCCLAVVLAIPGILSAQDGRMAARRPIHGADKPYSRVAAEERTFELTRTDPYGSKSFTRVFVAPGKGVPKPPPGLSELPRVGEVFVSPGLHEALKREPALAQLVPGRERGLIAAEGLAHPDELFAYVGMNRGELKEGTPVTGFGKEYPDVPTVEPSTLGILRFTLAGVVLLPLAVFLSVCARLSAASRTRRLAALRLLGLSTKGTQRVNAAETVAAALLGSLLGLGLYWVVNQLISRTGLPGFKWYPSDGALPASAVLICMVGCPALAWFVGRASARKAASNPLAVRRTAVEKPPGKWGLLLLIPGTGVVVGYCVIGATGRAPQDTSVATNLVAISVLLVGSGLALTLPVISRSLAQRLACSTQSLSLALAMRRNESEPHGALRVATGLVVLVFAASLTQGVLIELDQVSKSTRPVQDYNIPLTDVTDKTQQALEAVPGLRSHAVVMDSWADFHGDEIPPSLDAVIATCGQLRKMVVRADGCVDGRPMRLLDPDQLDNSDSKPGASFAFNLASTGQRRVMEVTVPREILRYRDHQGIPVFHSGAVLLPPSALPAGARPEDATLTLLSSSNPQTVRAVLDGIGGVDPTAEVTTPGVVVDSLQQITVVKTLLAVGMVLGLIIGVAAYLVAATDRAVERRPQVTALALLGARPRTLRAVQVTQVVMPLGVGLVLAVVAGKLAESSYLVTGGGAIFWDGDGVPLLLGCAVAVVAVAAVGALPLVGRRIDPELIRRD